MAGILWVQPALGAELSAGAIIDRSNLGEVEDATFEGRRIGDLLLPAQRQLITQYGMQVQLARSRPIVVSPDIIEATEQHASKAALDPQTRSQALRARRKSDLPCESAGRAAVGCA